MHTDDEYILAQEFLESPREPHSPGVRRLLREFRGAPATGKYVLIEIEPNRRWELATLSGKRAGGVDTVPGVEFNDIDLAERHVFKRRWNDSGRKPKLSLEE